MDEHPPFRVGSDVNAQLRIEDVESDVKLGVSDERRLVVCQVMDTAGSRCEFEYGCAC